MAPSDQFYQRLLAFRDEEAGKVARDFLKTHPFVELCDDVMIPALVHVKTAWQEEFLDERHFEFACDTVDEIVADLGSGSQPEWDSSNAPCSVLFLPASDAADETIAHMVASILHADGFRCETVSSDALAGEIVSRIADYPGAQICISAAPPWAQRHARYLVKRLTAVIPDTPVLVGIWGASEDRAKRLEAAESLTVVKDARGAVAEIKRRLPVPPQVAAAATALISTVPAGSD